MTSMARAYSTIFSESQDVVMCGNYNIARIGMQYETRFNSAIKALAKPYDVIQRILEMYPKQVYMAGGLVNLALDPLINITNPVFDKSDIDLFILAEQETRLQIINDILGYLNTVDNGEDNVAMCVGIRGSVVYIWHNCFKRMIQLVLMNTKCYPTIDSVIKGFDLDNIAVAYDGNELIVHQRALQAMNTRCAVYRPTSFRNDNQTYRMTKTACRGYKIIRHATSEEITPSLTRILEDKESRDYICTPYTDYKALFGRFLNENDNDRLDAAKEITEYYKANTTASEVFYIETAEELKSRVISLINSGGICNIQDSREYR